ncbi:MAG: hypothetical protein LBD21_00040 [Tannerellaceae bacterium]|jgi:hypothetical protein|nr:hypothetical protein [Tannerellaceae bacterium]
MENTKKTRKQFHLLGSEFIIKLAVYLLGSVAVVVLIRAFGASVSTAVGIYLGYRVLRLVMRLIGQILSIVFTVVSNVILIIIISLIII